MKSTILLLPLLVATVTGEPPKPVYGPPRTGGGGGGGGGGYVGGGDEISEPANYEFSYEVQDDKANLNFGHKESRQGELAQGSYHVFLPDGRTQKVDYVADEGGYMPKVTYDGEPRPDSYGPPGGSSRGGSVGGSPGVSVGGGIVGTGGGSAGGGYRY